MKKFLYGTGAILAAVLLIAGLHTAYLYTHREFGLSDFSHPFILQEKRRVDPEESLKEEARQALSQPFTYLGYGGQMTAYGSADGRFVIKFFNPRSVIKKSWFTEWRKLRYINSVQWVLRTHFMKKDKLRKQFSRYALAFHDLKDETGVVYVHLDPSTRLSHRMEIIDKGGVRHVVDLDTYPFVLQKRAELTLDYLGKLMDAGDLEAAQQGVRQIYALFFSRASKGYKDKFQALEKNYGFIEGRAVQFDVGRIRQVEAVRQNPSQEMQRIIAHILPVLEESFPELAPVLVECLRSNYSISL